MKITNQKDREIKIYDIDIDKIRPPKDALKKVAKHKAECPHMLAVDPTVSHTSMHANENHY